MVSYLSQLKPRKKIISAKKKPTYMAFRPLLVLFFPPTTHFPDNEVALQIFIRSTHTQLTNNTVDSTCLRRSLCCKDLLKGLWKRMPFSTGQPNEYFNRLSTVLSLRLLQSIAPEHSKPFTLQNQVALLGLPRLKDSCGLITALFTNTTSLPRRPLTTP